MGKSKILVVDDELDYVTSIEMRLRSEGYRTITARDGFQAVSAAIKEQPNLIILDINMPAGNGHSVVKRLRRNGKTCTIPILFLTASAQPADIKKAKAEGVQEYLVKPFKSEMLIEAVKRNLEQGANWNVNLL